MRKKKSRETLFNDSKTFSRRREAEVWIRRMEQAMSSSHPASFAARHATVAMVIERYLSEQDRVVGTTKAQRLRAIGDMEFGQLRAAEAGQTDILDLIATSV